MSKTKKEYEAFLNELLETDIRWSKLSKEELAKLVTIFTSPELLSERLGIAEPVARRFLRDRVLGAAEKWLREWRGPVATMLRELLGREKAKEEK